MSGADNFQEFLANHRQEKARVKALRAGLASPGGESASSPAQQQPSPANLAAAANLAASMGTTEPQWQLKVHSNDPRDVAARAAASPQQDGQFTIGGQTFLPARTAASPGGAQAGAAGGSSIGKSMMSAISSGRTPGKKDDGVAIHELQELSRLADMASGGHEQAAGVAGAGLTSPGETNRLKDQLDGMRAHLQQMHSVGDEDTQQLMSELERMKMKLRHVEGNGQQAGGDVENSLASGYAGYPSLGGYGGGNASPRKDQHKIQVASPGTGENRPQALTAAEARINVAYEGIKMLAQGLVILGLVLFFPGIFTPWGFVCWGNSLPLIALGLVYIYVRDPEISLPVPEAGSKSTKLFVGFTLTMSLLLVIGGSFSARGADNIKDLFYTPVCGGYDCSRLPDGFVGVPNATFVNDTAVVCMPTEQYAGSLYTCQSLGLCKGNYLQVGTCNGINGVGIFVAILCFISAVGTLIASIWCHTVLDVRCQEYRQLCLKPLSELQTDDFEFVDMSCGAFFALLCEDGAKIVGNIQRQGFAPDAPANNSLPADSNALQNRRNKPEQQQHGEAGRLTAEALEAKILTPAGRGVPAYAASPGKPQEYY